MLLLASQFSVSYKKVFDESWVTPEMPMWVITHASDVYKQKDRVRENNLRHFEERWYTYKTVDLLSPSWRYDLESCKLLFVPWWNVFYLAQCIQEANAKEALINWICNKENVYISSSAGSVILWPDLDQCLCIDYLDDAPLLKERKWLWVIPYAIIPHRWREKYTEKFENNLFKNRTFDWWPQLLMTNDQVLCKKEKKFYLI